MERIISQIPEFFLLDLDFTEVLVNGNHFFLLVFEKPPLKEAISVITIKINSLWNHSVLLFPDRLHVQVEINEPGLWAVLLDQD